MKRVDPGDPGSQLGPGSQPGPGSQSGPDSAAADPGKRHTRTARKRPITIALTGDSLIATPEVPVPGAAWEELRGWLSASDTGFTNLETPINDGLGHPTCRDTGTWCSANSDSLAVLRRLGFELFACANNHSLDWSIEGLLRTRQAIEDQDGSCAGIGATLAQAREPAYRATPAGAVALVAMCATYPDAWRAGDPRGEVPGRPGLNPLGHKIDYVVPSDLWPHLTRLNEALSLDANHRRRVRIGFAVEEPGDALHLLGQRFVRGEDGAYIRHSIDSRDGHGNLRAIADARANARVVIASIHSHEMGPAGEFEPAGFVPEYARQCIEAGADVVVCHGPHLLRGIEVYRNRPIFYSLGNFIFQNELNRLQPQEYYEKYGLGPEASAQELFDKRSESGGYPGERHYWESVMVRCRLDDSGLLSAELRPVSLGFGLPRERRGFPTLVAGEDAGRILATLDDLSKPFGVRVSSEGNSGHLEWGGAPVPHQKAPR